MNRSSRQKNQQEKQDLNDTLDQIDLTDIYRTFHPKAARYTFFSSAHRTLSRIDHILGHISSLGKILNVELGGRTRWLRSKRSHSTSTNTSKKTHLHVK